MTIKHQAFLDLEESLAARLRNAWAQYWGTVSKELEDALAAGQYDKAHQIADSVTLASLFDKHRPYARTVGMAALLLGASRLGDHRTSKIAKNPPTKELDGYLSQMQTMLARNATQRLRDMAHAWVAEEEHKLIKYDPDQPRDWHGRWTDAFTFEEEHRGGKVTFNHIVVNGKRVGHISGFVEHGAFRIYRTQIDKAYRGTGLYRQAVQAIADRYAEGAFTYSDESSPQLQATLRKMPTYQWDDFDGRNALRILPSLIKAEWDESDHPRGKTTEDSTPGSFAPKGANPDSPVFKKWFKGSKVVDSDGRPLAVYHGTKTDPVWTTPMSYEALTAELETNLRGIPKDLAALIRANHERLRGAVWFTESESIAYGYRDEVRGEGAVLTAYIALRNPLDLRAETLGVEGVAELLSQVFGTAVTVSTMYGAQRGAAQAIGHDNTRVVSWAREQGYDGLIHDDTDITGRYLHTSYVAFDPVNQVRVAALMKWDESQHPRGKTTPESTPGSFAPAGTGVPAVDALLAGKPGYTIEQWATEQRTKKLLREGQALADEQAKLLAEARGKPIPFFENGIPWVNLYHGTSADVMHKILKEGLLPGSETGVRRWEEEVYYTDPVRANSVFLNTDKDTAVNWAKHAVRKVTNEIAQALDEDADNIDPVEAVLVHVAMPKEAYDATKVDSFTKLPEHRMHTGKIPPEWITGYTALTLEPDIGQYADYRVVDEKHIQLKKSHTTLVYAVVICVPEKYAVAKTELRKADANRNQVKINVAGKQFFALASSVQVSRLSAFGFLMQAAEQGLQNYRIDAVLDEHTCEVCKLLDGTVFPVGTGMAHAQLIMDTSDPDALKQIAPFYAQNKTSLAFLRDYSTDDLIEAGMQLPPYHPLCRCILTPTDEPVDIHPTDQADRVALASQTLYGAGEGTQLTQQLFGVDVPPEAQITVPDITAGEQRIADWLTSLMQQAPSAAAQAGETPEAWIQDTVEGWLDQGAVPLSAIASPQPFEGSTIPAKWAAPFDPKRMASLAASRWPWLAGLLTWLALREPKQETTPEVIDEGDTEEGT